MLKFQNYFWILVLGVLFVSCKEDKKFEKTAEGTEYMIFDDGDGIQLAKGQVVEANVYEVIFNADTSVQPRKYPNPMKFPLDNFGKEQLEIMMKAKVGDSIIMKMPMEKANIASLLPANKIAEENWLRLEIKIISAQLQSDIDDKKIGAFFSKMPEGYQKSDAGYIYKVIEQGEGQAITKGMNLDVYMNQYLQDSGQILMPKESKAVQFISVLEDGEIPMLDPLKMAKEGDSISIVFPITSKLKMQMPPSLSETTELRMEVRILKAIDQAEVDDTLIKQYMEENNISATKSASGLYYTISGEATGDVPATGDTVVANYTGTLLSGKQFDSSIGSPRGPLEFPLGMGNVIKGWDEGFSLMKKGQKATFLIPSQLAYGRAARGEDITANSILKFEVELLDIKKDPSN